MWSDKWQDKDNQYRFGFQIIVFRIIPAIHPRTFEIYGVRGKSIIGYNPAFWNDFIFWKNNLFLSNH
jgi:hypothetical protein